MQPVTKKSKMRKRTRRSHHALTPAHVQPCPNCNHARLPHCACQNCGYVNANTRIKTGAASA